MNSSTVFSQSVLKTKKPSKIKLLFLALGRIIKNNPKLFFFCSLLAVMTAIINFNIGVNFKDAFISEEKSLTSQIVKEIEEEGDRQRTTIEKKRIKEIVEKVFRENEEKRAEQEKWKAKIASEIGEEGRLEKKEAKEIIEKNDPGRGNIWKKSFKFKFIFFKWKFEVKNLSITGFIVYNVVLILGVKSSFSVLHFYLMGYAYDSIERDLKKDLFRHLVRAKYANAAEISPNLITQFANDLDNIAYSIWFIPNRLIYVFTSIFYYVFFDFSFGSAGINWEFAGILFGLFAVLVIIEVILFKKATKLSVAAKKRYEEDNKIIYERINNLEYIKAVSGEKYEEEKVSQQLNSTFWKNKKSLWYSVLFKAVPNYIVIPNIPIIFVALALNASSKEKHSSVFYIANFIRYYFTARNLNNEVNKITESLLTLDELSSNLTLVNESAKVLNRSILSRSAIVPAKIFPFENSDLVFQNVVFAYPQRPQNILRNFSFRFEQGKIYGIAGKNGIGKSTITKTTLKLYDLKEGQILIGEHNLTEIDTASLHQHICYQTNRPTFFRMSIAENVFYPYKYDKKDAEKLIKAAQKTGILEFIKKLPNEFDTELKEGGTDLSEGQKQQIAAMRIFIRDYDIYFLDEILSNVHPNLKGTILQNIFAKLKGKTVLVIDHHYEIFQYVDYVYQFTGEKLIKMKKEDYLIS